MPVEEALASGDPDFEVTHHTLARPAGILSIDRRLSRSRECYRVAAEGQTAHLSWLHRSVRLPRRFGFDGAVPVIGDCHTPERFRGRSIYPQVLRFIARDVARCSSTPVYVLVSPANLASIRGIEKAGFRRLARLRGTRFAGWVLGKSVERLP
jgi:hypothetical protein